MKTFLSAKVLIGFLISIVLLFAGCGRAPDRPSQSEVFFNGNRPLQRLMPSASQEGNLTGGFFLFAGAVSGGTATKQLVKFAWKSNIDDTYIISSIPLEKVRVKFNDKQEERTVSFKLTCDNNNCDGDFALKRGYGQQYAIDTGVEYVVFTVKSDDWPVKIQMPMQ